jgi:Flp pilus assembly protein protease CpaA
MEILVISFLITVIWLILASISDLKTREVPNWLSYSLIVIGIVFNMIGFVITKDKSILINSLIGFSICFVIANVMYYSRQWGGGDAKLLIGLGIILSTYPKYFSSVFQPKIGGIPFIVTVLMNIMLTGVFYGICWSIYLGINHRTILKKDLKENFKKNKKYRYLISWLTLGLLILSFFLEPMLKLLVLICGFSLFLLFYLSLFIKSVENSCMFKQVSIDKLTEGDWVTEKIVINNSLIYDPKNTGITIKDIEHLKKFKDKISSVTVKEGIPFIPSFLIGVLISILIGNIIFYFV